MHFVHFENGILNNNWPNGWVKWHQMKQNVVLINPNPCPNNANCHIPMSSGVIDFSFARNHVCAALLSFDLIAWERTNIELPMTVSTNVEIENYSKLRRSTPSPVTRIMHRLVCIVNEYTLCILPWTCTPSTNDRWPKVFSYSHSYIVGFHWSVRILTSSQNVLLISRTNISTYVIHVYSSVHPPAASKTAIQQLDQQERPCGRDEWSMVVGRMGKINWICTCDVMHE